MRIHTLLLALATTTLAFANFSSAQEQPAQPAATVPAPASVATAPASAPTVPARGATMQGVKAKFGAPTQEVPPVGTPAITRWDYPGFAVFFESDKVLHTVIARS